VVCETRFTFVNRYEIERHEDSQLSISARSGFISSQTGDSIKTLEKDYGKYIEEADNNRNFVDEQIQKSAVRQSFLIVNWPGKSSFHPLKVKRFTSGF
jgi:hypothetical protein